MTDPSDPRLTALRVALANLGDAMAKADEAAAESLPDLRAAVDEAREAFDDPDPPEPEPLELLPDKAAVDQAFEADDPAAFLAQRAAELGGTASAAEALRRVLRAGDRGDPVPPDQEIAAGRELDRHEHAARRKVRLALLDDGVDSRDARKRLADVQQMRAVVAMAVLGRPVASGRIKPRPAKDVAEPRPESVLQATNMSGSVLTAGNVMMIAGEGGIAKSPLTLSIGPGLAGLTPPDRRDFAEPAEIAPPLVALPDLIFEGRPGPVLFALYEDTAADARFRLGVAATKLFPDETERRDAALANVYLLEMGSRPLFGPTEAGRSLYNSRPGPLEGWHDLWGAVREIGPTAVVIDPAMSAYDGDAIAAAPVRGFFEALRWEARRHGCGVIMVAHTNKTSRNPTKSRSSSNDSDPYDPGAVSGSSQWTDAPRGTLRLDQARGQDVAAGALELRVCKANYGRRRIAIRLAKLDAESGEICGFMADANAKWEGDPKTSSGKTEEAAPSAANGGDPNLEPLP